MGLDYYIQIIQEKKKKQTIRDVITQIASRYPLVLHKKDGAICIFPQNTRTIPSVSIQTFDTTRDSLGNFSLDALEGESLFSQFQNLLQTVPQPQTIHFSDNENSGYSHCVFASRNIYMSFTVIEDVENCLYSFSVKTGSRNVYNSLLVREHSENIFESKAIIQSFNVFYSHYISNSSNIRFSSNLIGCDECLFCHDLENKKHCIYNKQYSPTEYAQEKIQLLQQKDRFGSRQDSISNVWSNSWSNAVDGSFIIHSEHIQNGYCVYDIKHAKNVILVWWRTTGEHIYSTLLITPPFENAYGVMSSWTWCSHVYNSIHINGGSYIFYSQLLTNCSYCIGCIWLKNKEFCIFNKQYTKDEWHMKAEEILKKMNEEGALGEFFPGWMCPFYYNDTVAYLLNPSITKEEVTKLGYLRRDEAVKVDIPSNVEVVKTNELGVYEWYSSEWVRHIDPSILDKIIVDQQGNYYRIVRMEYDFLVKYSLPLPRKHWLNRLKMHFDLGLKTWS